MYNEFIGLSSFNVVQHQLPSYVALPDSNTIELNIIEKSSQPGNYSTTFTVLFLQETPNVTLKVGQNLDQHLYSDKESNDP